ncbi:GNAT family N-acetyltransferase [Mesorhizobium sp. CAU 1741]|uniref:GNAT family N-acetyltransferase n=1 Tax=Mesorhizobium sp. CAU 1741 TaxID=3140366 RepID=UPI00325B0B17
MLTKTQIALQRVDADFDRMAELLALVLRAFAYMDGVIDPPSSAKRLTVESLRNKCAGEIATVALDAGAIVGCVFLSESSDHFYLGKLAVDPARQGAGIGKMLMAEAERIALAAGKPVIELQTRVELTGNQSAFARMGFVETARTAHDGYDRPTSITLRKALS